MGAPLGEGPAEPQSAGGSGIGQEPDSLSTRLHQCVCNTQAGYKESSGSPKPGAATQLPPCVTPDTQAADPAGFQWTNSRAPPAWCTVSRRYVAPFSKDPEPLRRRSPPRPDVAVRDRGIRAARPATMAQLEVIGLTVGSMPRQWRPIRTSPALLMRWAGANCLHCGRGRSHLRGSAVPLSSLGRSRGCGSHQAQRPRVCQRGLSDS